jgi:hypothetical protein
VQRVVLEHDLKLPALGDVPDHSDDAVAATVCEGPEGNVSRELTSVLAPDREVVLGRTHRARTWPCVIVAPVFLVDGSKTPGHEELNGVAAKLAAPVARDLLGAPIRIDDQAPGIDHQDAVGHPLQHSVLLRLLRRPRPRFGRVKAARR